MVVVVVVVVVGQKAELLNTSPMKDSSELGTLEDELAKY